MEIGVLLLTATAQWGPPDNPRELEAALARRADDASGLRDGRQAAADAGRAAAQVTPALFVSVRIDDDIENGRRAMEAYSPAVYGMPLEDLERIQAVVTSSADQVLQRRGQYAAAQHIVARPGAPDLRSQRDRLERIADLVPAVQKAVGHTVASEGA
ncbi:hypothetical protein ACWDVU_20110 [Streptomyces sp. NPDC003333]